MVGWSVVLAVLQTSIKDNLNRPDNQQMTPTNQVVIFRYIASLGFNFFGVGIQDVCILWILLELTRSPSSVGMLLVLRGLVATFLSPHTGSLRDRMDRRRLSSTVNFLVGEA